MEKEKSVDNNAVTSNGFKRSVFRQVTLGLITNFSSIAPSMSLGFSAVALPALTSATMSANPLTLEQASWFASIASLITPLGCFFSGPISDKYGRRTAMLVVNFVGIIGWIVIASAYHMTDYQYEILLLGRMLTGLSTGLSCMPCTVYMAEVSSSNLRGMFCTASSVAFALGVFIVYLFGYMMDSWGTIAMITTFFPCIGLATIFFLIPESPSWLVRKNQLVQAKKSMCSIFGTKDYIPEVEHEVELLIKNIEVKTDHRRKSPLEQCARKLQYLMKPTCLKPFVLILFFFFFQQFSGTFVIVFYAIDIVKESGITFDPYITVVLIGFVRVLTTVLVSFISKIFGRRTLALVSGSGMSICMLALALYVYKASQLSGWNFVPVILLLLHFFTSTIGFVPLPFVLSAEVFPGKIRGTASGLTAGFGYVFNFIAVKIYPNMIQGMGKELVFTFYGVAALAGTIFIALLLPETRGKSLQEIEEYFGGKKDSRKQYGSLLEKPADKV